MTVLSENDWPDRILADANRLTDFQVWPTSEKLNAKGWLNNFGDSDKKLASALLQKFMYYSEALTDRMLESSFNDICNLERTRLQNAGLGPFDWKSFVDNCLITYPTGEEPNPTDSGQLFARKCRQKLGISQSQIVTPAQAVKRLDSGSHLGAVIFVDDFSGSGDQFVFTWYRQEPNSIGDMASFQSLYANGVVNPVYYATCISTDTSVKAIHDDCKPVVVRSGNNLSHRYSALDPESVIWPVALRAEGQEFIERISKNICLLYTSPSPRDATLSRMPSSA